MKKFIGITLFIALTGVGNAQSDLKIEKGIVNFPDRDHPGVTHPVPIYKNAVLAFSNGVELIYYIRSTGEREFEAVQQFYEGKELFGQTLGKFTPTSQTVGIGGGIRNEIYQVVISKACGDPADPLSTINVMVRIFLSEFNSVFVSVMNHCAEDGI